MDIEALRVKVRPEQTALIIIDMQKDYCCEGGGFDRRGFDVVPAQRLAVELNKFVKKARGLLKCIVHLKMTKVAELASPVGAELYRRLGVERKYDPAYADFYGVIPEDGDTVIPKYKYSGFVSTYLDQFLRLNDIKTLIITGLATNVCVETTARDAFMRDYYTVVPSDLTEATSPEAKKASLANIDAFFGEVVDSMSLLRCWQPNDQEGR
jgi:ureidoacrylate peracid hydrolase